MCKWSLLIDSAIFDGDHTSLHSHSASCLHPPNLKRSKTPFTFPPFRAVPVVARSALGSERSSPSPLSSSDPSATAPSPAPSPHPVPSLAPSPVPAAALGALRREGQPAGFGQHRRRRPRALLVGRPLCAARRCCKRGLRHPQRLGGWEWGWTIALRPPKEHETWPWLCGLKLFGEAVYSKSFRCSSLCCMQLCLCLQVEFCELQYFFRVSGAHRFWAVVTCRNGSLAVLHVFRRVPRAEPLLMSNEFHPGYVPLSHVVCTPLVHQSSSPRVFFLLMNNLANPQENSHILRLGLWHMALCMQATCTTTLSQ